MNKPILCLDFDGVIHSYESGWKGAHVIPDAPVPGAMDFIDQATDKFIVAIFSSRSNQAGGIEAMQGWLRKHFYAEHADIAGSEYCDDILALIQWPTEKPPAFIGIDDRVLTFTGEWPSVESLAKFKPWNKRNV